MKASQGLNKDRLSKYNDRRMETTDAVIPPHDSPSLGSGSQIPFPVLADLAGLAVFKDCGEHPILRAFRALLEDWAVLSPNSDSAGVGPYSEAEFLKNPGKKGDLRGFSREFHRGSSPWESPVLRLPRRWAALMGRLGTAAGPGAGAAPAGGSFFSRVRELALSSDNPFTLAAERTDRGEAGDGTAAVPPFLVRLAAGDLNRLGRIAAFDVPALGFSIALYLRSWGLEDAAAGMEAEARSLWEAEGLDRTAGEESQGLFRRPLYRWGDSLEAFTAHIARRGAGIFSRSGFFRWVPSRHPGVPGFPRPVPRGDPVSLADLAGYRDQRLVVIDNTLSFLEGKAANNLLLYGDRGTGKSATVKAVCREYADRGLRLLELHKEDTGELPAILEFTASRGLKFVIFIDDLSFEDLDDSFTSLKALLEGGVEARPSNTVIYATSNRRHLVRERLTDRPAVQGVPPGGTPGDGDIRSFDTLQEQLSLSDRFGLTLFFTTPGQEEYLEIARFIAERRGLAPDDKFREDALRWEKWFNGRSPRTASQFVDWLAGAKPFPWARCDLV
jgi:predicted AAA+ superfamily ATPase